MYFYFMSFNMTYLTVSHISLHLFLFSPQHFWLESTSLHSAVPYGLISQHLSVGEKQHGRSGDCEWTSQHCIMLWNVGFHRVSAVIVVKERVTQRLSEVVTQSWSVADMYKVDSLWHHIPQMLLILCDRHLNALKKSLCRQPQKLDSQCSNVSWNSM